MSGAERLVVTASGAVCGAGMSPADICDAILEGRSAIAPITQWDTSAWPRRMGAELRTYSPAALLGDRKLAKLIRRTDVLGLYAAARAIDAAGFAAHRTSLGDEASAAFADSTGVYVGSGGGSYESQYEYLPLLAEADGSLKSFGEALTTTVNPMWLLRTLPNNVLCHIGIRHALKGANACITNHTLSGPLALGEAAHAIREREARRAIAVAHDAPIEPQMLLYYHRIGVIAEEAIRPFDAARDGSVLGEGAAAIVLETKRDARARGARVQGEYLSASYASEATGLTAIRDDGEGLARAIERALELAAIDRADIGMIVAHANGTRQSDASEARAIERVFGERVPPVTAFKWAIGHLLAASGLIETVLALEALGRGVVPGIATLERYDPALPALPVSRETRPATSDIALVLCRGFGGTNAAVLVRARTPA